MNNFTKIYCDFDGTISKKDTLCTFFDKYADKKWLEVEDLWQRQEISSKECLERQVALVKHMNEDELNEYINSIEIDDSFIEFYNYLKSKDIELIILSDGFELFIAKTLEKYSLLDVKYFANTLKYENGSFSVDFLNHSENCKVKAGSCKCEKVKEQEYCYIGDGLSDACVAKNATILFAKGNLRKFCEKMDLKYNSFNSFLDIIDYCRRGETDATAYSINY